MLLLQLLRVKLVSLRKSNLFSIYLFGYITIVEDEYCSGQYYNATIAETSFVGKILIADIK